MVKAPNVRHSKTRRDPVTIDLKAESAGKVETEAPAAAAEGQSKSDTAQRPSAATPNVSPASGSKLDDVAKATPAFGRDAGKADVRPENKPADPKPAFAEAASAKPAASRPASPPPSSAPEPARRGGVSAIAAGLIGGIVALAGAGGLQWAGLLPSPGGTSVDTSAFETQIAELKTQIASLPAPANDGARIDALAAELQETKAQLSAVSGATPSPEAAQALDERFKALEAGLAAAQGAAPAADLAPVNGRIDTVEAAASSAAQTAQKAEAAAAAIGDRVNVLETSVAELSGKVAEQAEQPKAALAIAASALKAAIDRGDTFTTEVDTLAAITQPSPELDALRSFAASGVSSREQIVAAFPAAGSAMIAAAQPVDPNAGIIDRLMASAQSLVQVRPVGMVEGEGVGETVARMEVQISKGDYAAAVAEYDKLEEPAKTAGASFIALLKSRIDADKAMDTILANALKA